MLKITLVAVEESATLILKTRLNKEELTQTDTFV